MLHKTIMIQNLRTELGPILDRILYTHYADGYRFNLDVRYALFCGNSVLKEVNSGQ